MGASQSSTNQGAGGGGRQRPTTSDGIDVHDYYGLLELPDPDSQISSSDEIRKSYRRLALRYHPDKNPDNVEAANERFRLLQAAYEILSDDQERAWYDSHRVQILQGSMDDDDDGLGNEDAFDEETFQQFRTGKQRPPPAPTGSSAPGLSPRQILRFMDASLCMDVTPPSADETGFFATYRRIFERLADEEKGAAPYPGEQTEPYETLPGFGYSHTPYMFNVRNSKDDEQTVHQTQAREFYAIWSGFQTRKGFAWRDGYRLNDAPDRRVKRAMEKENKRMREASRREYNDTVRSLVMFVRKRDPRFKAYLATQQQAQTTNGGGNSAASAEEMQRRREAAAREMREQQERARAYKKQSWDAWEHGGADTSDEDDDSEASFGQDGADMMRKEAAASNTLSDEEEEQQQQQPEDGQEEADELDGGDDLICYACDKAFQSAASFANHERSNKHKKQVQKIRREMLKEDRELQRGMRNVDIARDDDIQGEIGSEGTALSGEQQDPTAGISKKAKQRMKKRMREQEKAANSNSGTAQASEDEVEAQTNDEVSVGMDDMAALNEKIGGVGDVESENTQEKEEQEQAQESTATGKKSRRAKKQANAHAAKERCNVCKTSFDSRSKLFNHIRQTGHALAAGSTTTTTTKR